MMYYVRRPWLQFFKTYQFIAIDHHLTPLSKIILKSHLSLFQVSKRMGMPVENIKIAIFANRHSLPIYAKLSKIFHISMLKMMIHQKNHHDNRLYNIRSEIWSFLKAHRNSSNDVNMICLCVYLKVADSSIRGLARSVYMISSYLDQLSHPLIYYLHEINQYHYLQVGSPAYILLDYLIMHCIDVHDIYYSVGSYQSPVSRVLNQQKRCDTVPYHDADRITHALHINHQIFHVNIFNNYARWHKYRTQCRRIAGPDYNRYDVKIYNLKKQPALWMRLRFMDGQNVNDVILSQKMGVTPKTIPHNLRKKILPQKMESLLIKAYPKYRNYFAYAAQDETNLVSASDLASLAKIMLICHHLMPIHLERIIDMLIYADRLSVRCNHVHLFNDPVKMDFRGKKHIPPVKKYLIYGATNIITDDDHIRSEKLQHLLTGDDLSLIYKAFKHEYRPDLKKHHSIFPGKSHKYMRISVTCKIRSKNLDYVYQKMVWLLTKKAHGSTVTQIQFKRCFDNICVATGYIKI